MDAYEKALALLSIREHTKKEIRVKLLNRGFSPESVDSAIERLSSEGWLSEERFAESYVRSRVRKSPEGKRIILMRMREKGTPLETAERALDEAWSSKAYLEPLLEYYSALVRKKGEVKAEETLYKKGFSYSEIKEAKELYKSQGEDEIGKEKY